VLPFVYDGIENPQNVTEHERQKVSVWCALMKNKVTVIDDTFLFIIENTVSFHVPVRTISELDCVLPPFCHRVRAFLDREFPGRSFSRFDTSELFLEMGRVVKYNVYREKVQTVNELADSHQNCRELYKLQHLARN
jgi:hypothetical protein